WSLYYLCGTNTTLIAIVFWASIAVLALFTLGICTRITSVLSWVALVSATANPAIAYEGDFLLTMPAFYLSVGYVLFGLSGKDLSLRSILFGPQGAWILGGLKRPDAPAHKSVAANLGLRLLQVHFAIVMLASAFHKMQIGDWWEGVAFWFPLHLP